MTETFSCSWTTALFVQRAQEIDSTFTLTEANAPDLAEICIALDGLPLAIELAVARTRLLAPSAIRARLSGRLALLTDGPRDQPLRLRTMRDAIAWSYDLLSPAEQLLFRRLSVFVGSFSLEVIDFLAPGSSEIRDRSDDAALPSGDALTPIAATMHLFSQLVEKSLVQTEAQEADDTKFRILETVREYGLEQLIAAGEGLEARDLHATTYLTLAECAEHHLRGPRQAFWFDRLRAPIKTG